MNIKQIILCLSALILININSKGQNSYLLTSPSYAAGFFSTFNTVVGCLDAYESLKWDGLKINFQDKGLYYDPSVGENWWSYYFEPIELGATEAELKKIPNYKKIVFSLSAEFDLTRHRAHDLIQKYIKLKPHIHGKIDTFVQQEFADYFIIGVHYRGTDKKAEAPEVSYEAVYSQIQEAFKNNSSKKVKVFVATDDGNFFAYIKKKFPDQLIAWNSARSLNGQAIHQSSLVDISNYKKGEDALIDCVLLSRSHVLIKTASNLSDCSLQFNPSLPVTRLNVSFNEESKSYSGGLISTIEIYLALLDQYEKGKRPGVKSNFNQDEWEKHFKPFSVGSTKHKESIFNFYATILNLTNQYEMSASRANEIIKKYIKIKRPVTKKVKSVLKNSVKSKFVIGCYYQMDQSMAQLQPRVPHGTVIDAIKKALTHAPKNYKVLFVTDDAKFKNILKKTFGKHALDLQGENLESILLLGKCKTVIATSSRFSITVQQLNPSVPMIYLDADWLALP